MKKRIGIIGGTFDPPHRGHIVPVAHIVREFSLDRVYFVPAFRSPHKRNSRATDPFHRAAMLALAIRRFPEFVLSTYELSQGKIVYSADTLQYFSTLYPQERLFFILGADSFLDLKDWRSPARLLELSDFIIINRGVSKQELNRNLEQLEQRLDRDLRKRVHFSSFRHLHVSSTQVRNAIFRKRSVSRLVPADVENYIRKHSLYMEVRTDRDSR